MNQTHSFFSSTFPANAPLFSFAVFSPSFSSRRCSAPCSLTMSCWSSFRCRSFFYPLTWTLSRWRIPLSGPSVQQPWLESLTVCMFDPGKGLLFWCSFSLCFLAAWSFAWAGLFFISDDLGEFATLIVNLSQWWVSQRLSIGWLWAFALDCQLNCLPVFCSCLLYYIRLIVSGI